MGIVLGDNQYGKAETRIVRVTRDGPRHEIADLNVSITLGGDLAGTHLTGDNANVLPTDSQKNAVYAFARESGIGEIEDFGLRLARHFVDGQPSIHRARVHLEQYGWQRLGDHSFQRDGAAVRTATVTYDGRDCQVVSGITGLVLLNSTASEFHGFIRDPYTTLPETRDRILATAVDARWRHDRVDPAGEAGGRVDAPPAGSEAVAARLGIDWAASYVAARGALVAAFVETYSYSLQQTLYAMGQRVLAECPEVVEIRLSLPNKHHLPVDLAPFGLDNPGEVFVATDRPYGLIEGTVLRADAPEPGLAWW
jgi:urate oxidase